MLICNSLAIYFCLDSITMHGYGGLIVDKAKQKKKPGRPASGKRRPVVALRVHEDMFENITSEAARLKLTISQEVARRLDRYAEYVASFGEIKKMLDEARKSQKLSFEAQLRNAGYTPIVGTDGTLWAEPGTKAIGQLHGAIVHPDVIAAIEAAVERGMKKAAS
jgi:hypothetical protein